jgi:peptidoglycan/LPS O-acetylase OafA/YrhL
MGIDPRNRAVECGMASAANTNLGHNWTRVDGIDLLRGIAIFLVLMNHVNMRLFLAKVPYTQGLPHQLVASLVWHGQLGVHIFFAVSGFLITSTTLRRWGSLGDISVRDFYWLRFARIAPLLLLLLLVLSAFHFAGMHDFVVGPKTGGLGRALLAALTFHVNVLEARRGYLPGNWDILWSLSVEEMFYLFFPILCWLLARTRPRDEGQAGVRKTSARSSGRMTLMVTLLLVFVALGPFARTVLAHGNEVWEEYSYLGGMDAIALGCLTALLSRKIRFSSRALQILAATGSALMALILFFSISMERWFLLNARGLDMSILAAGTCMLIIAAAQTQWSAPRLLRPLLDLGQRSYEVYLTHMFVVFGFFGLFVLAGKPLSAVPVLFGAVIVISALLGDLTARFFSEPLNRWLRNARGDGADTLGAVVETESTPA